MFDYFCLGFAYLKSSIILAVVIYIGYFIGLRITNNKKLKELSSTSKIGMVCEFMLIAYMCTILKVTGIIGRDFFFDFSIKNLSGLFTIPFVGSSIMMIILNTMLFVPYGILVSFVFANCKLNWKKALMIGFFSSLCIELFQAFTGRLCEIDDLIMNTCGFLIGFLLMQSFKKIISKELREKGIKQLLLTMIIAAVAIFLISFAANGDALQEEEEEYYTEIGGREEETAVIDEFKIYQRGKLFDVFEDLSGDWEMWYQWMGNDIGNIAGSYQIQSISTNMKEIVEQENDKTYMEVIYHEPQVFRFYNNKEWTLEGIVHIVFCVEDGSLWYGQDKASLEGYAWYVDEEYPFSENDSLKTKINEWINR